MVERVDLYGVVVWLLRGWEMVWGCLGSMSSWMSTRLSGVFFG
jgi:hypothetical protein